MALEQDDGSAVGSPLTLEQVQKSLSKLGHNGYGEIAFTKVSLKEMQLTSLEPLSWFPFLQHVSLDNNRLTTLRPLENMVGLVHLSARNNQLGADGVFPFLTKSATSLEHLHLEGNRLRTLSGLSNLPYLMDVSVGHNSLTELNPDDFSTLHGLTRFAANDNSIDCVAPNVFSASRLIRSLDLNNNKISNLHFLAYATAQLETLLLSHNSIASLGATVSECRSLVVLDISFNALASVEELHSLCPAKLLRHVTVTGNPFWVEDDGSIAAGETADSRAALGKVSEINGRRFNEETVTKDAADLAPTTAALDAMQPLAAATAFGSPSGTIDEHNDRSVQMDYATLAVPSVYGVVRHVLTASRMAVVPWDTDRAAELVRLPPLRQILLQLIHMLPSLVKVNDTDVEPEDVARAKFFFAGPAPA